jgi:hypothetical protein
MQSYRLNACEVDPDRRRLRIAAGNAYEALQALFMLVGTTLEEAFWNEMMAYIQSLPNMKAKVAARTSMGVLKLVPTAWLHATARLAKPKFRGSALNRVLEKHREDIGKFLKGNTRGVSLKRFFLDYVCSAMSEKQASKLINDITTHIERFMQRAIIPSLVRRVLKQQGSKINNARGHA